MMRRALLCFGIDDFSWLYFNLNIAQLLGSHRKWRHFVPLANSLISIVMALRTSSHESQGLTAVPISVFVKEERISN
jgi:hypothetical protein